MITILGIESSCDDTAAAVIQNGKILANVVAGQEVHKIYGGVVPELASRAHQQNIVPVVDTALKKANIKKEDINAIAYTRGPGLIGSLLVGSSFAKGMALGLNIPLIEVHHIQAHIMAHFINEAHPSSPPEGREKQRTSRTEGIAGSYSSPSGRLGGASSSPQFPFLCLTVSGGHTQIVLVKDYFDQQIIGKTTDDAAGEAFDKAAKIMGLPYPGGPLVDKFAKEGNAEKFKFPHPRIQNLDFSFSGLKTSFLYFIQNQVKETPDFIEKNKNDICASIQATIVAILMDKLKKAAEQTGIQQIAIAGGVSANSGLRNALFQAKENYGWNVFIPKLEYCTDNAAMIAITGYYKYLKNDFSSQGFAPQARCEM